MTLRRRLAQLEGKVDQAVKSNTEPEQQYLRLSDLPEETVVGALQALAEIGAIRRSDGGEVDTALLERLCEST